MMRPAHKKAIEKTMDKVFDNFKKVSSIEKDATIHEQIIRSRKSLLLKKTVDMIFANYRTNNVQEAEDAIKLAMELFSELYHGTTSEDFSKFIVLTKVNKQNAEQILSDKDIPDKLSEIIIYNLDKMS